MAKLIDSADLLARLIRCKSVTPENDGAMEILIEELSAIGFKCEKLVFSDKDTPDVVNLYARYGDKAPNLCFAGHTDVVPEGEGWTEEAFGGNIKNGRLYGRGAVDMKGGVACFVSAVSSFIAEKPDFDGSISFLITGDEEGIAINGTKKVLKWMEEKGEKIDGCLVGEPSNPNFVGQEIKIGRRGSLNTKITVYGTQGHVAKQEQANNPVPYMLNILRFLTEEKLDEGNENFAPSNLEITTVDVGNPTTNLIPSKVSAGFNIRFCNIHTSKSLMKLIEEKVEKAAEGANDYKIEFDVSGEAFLSEKGPLFDTVEKSVEKITGKKPVSDTSGGTSDARFIKDYCSDILEFGLVGATMHKADEHTELEDVKMLTSVYLDVLREYF